MKIQRIIALALLLLLALPQSLAADKSTQSSDSSQSGKGADLYKHLLKFYHEQKPETVVAYCQDIYSNNKFKPEQVDMIRDLFFWQGCESSDSQYLLKSLIDLGADVNSANEYGSTPFMLACRYNPNADIVQFLIDNSAKIDVADNDGMYPIHYAATNYNPDVIALLIQAGAEINNKNNKYKYTPLKISRITKNSEVESILLQHNATE